MSGKNKTLSELPNIEGLKIKVPQPLPLQLLYTTDYCDYCIYLFKCIQKLKRGTDEHKATVKLYRRLLALHQKQLRDRTKAVRTFLIIKTLLQERDHFTGADVAHISRLCENIHVKTLHSRLKTLQSLQLVEYRNGNVFIASWEQLCKAFKIEVKYLRFHFVRYGRNTLATVIQRIAMQKKEAQCLQAANYKLNKVIELQQEVKSVSGKGDLAAVKELQQQVYLNPHLATAFNLDTWLLFEVCRGDTALSYRFWSCLFGYKSIGGFAHFKRRLITGGLIAVFKRATVLPNGLKTSSKTRSSCLGTCVFNPATRQTVFIQPDHIVYLTLNA